MSKSKYQNKADEVFKEFPKEKEAFVTSDEQGFINENRAKLHASSLKDKTIHTFKREGEIEEKADEPVELTVKQLEEFARDSSDIPALEKMLEDEKAKGKTARKGAVSALETRIQTLKEA